MKLYEYCKDRLAIFNTRIYAKNKKLVWAVVLVVLSVLILLHYITSHKTAKPVALPVATAAAAIGDFDLYIAALGSVTPQYTVNITSQVNGQILKYHFKDGQDVKEGELLIEIDPSFYQAQLQQNEGQLARDIALLQNARLDLKRYEALWKENSISKQILDTQKALVDQYIGTVELDKGLVESSKVDLAYCNIMAPVTGRIGLSLIDQGNVVQSSASTPIAVVNTITPITVIFAVSERDLPKILKHANTLTKLKVEAYDSDHTSLLAVGNIIALDNQINTLTGTVNLRALFPNTDFKLFPKQFVNIKLFVDKFKNALIIPTAAVQHSNNGTFVYLVNDENKINIRKITASYNAEGKTVVSSGINAGDLLVTEGTDKLTEGTLVSQIKNEPPVSKKKNEYF